MPDLEEQYHLDIVMDTKRPHWTWVQDILALYRSTLIYSNGTYKIISERDDLPTRMVFHAGNMVPGQTTVRVGGDTLRPNQAEIRFAAEDRDYEQDIRYVTDSSGVAAEGVKQFGLNLQGITRWTEAIRNASIQLKKRRLKRREVTWATGIEAVPLEQGDMAIVGIPTEDFENGYGGRALDGSSRHIVLDREVDLQAGFTYDVHLWHAGENAPDFYELRTVGTGGVTITVSPTAAFSAEVKAGDRWAIGITSEDLIRVRVTSIKRRDDGLTEITGEEHIPLSPDLDCPGSAETVFLNEPPSQPSTVSISTSGCELCVNATFVSCQGGTFVDCSQIIFAGQLTQIFGVFLQPTHNPVRNSLIGDSLSIISGPASGRTYEIDSWTGADSYFARIFTSPFSSGPEGTSHAPPNSGDSYFLSLRAQAAGIEVDFDCGNGFERVAFISGTSGCAVLDSVCDNPTVRLTPISNRGQENLLGTTSATVAVEGCADSLVATQAQSFTGTDQEVFFRTTVPASELVAFPDRIDADIFGRVTEACSPNEQTLMRLALEYGGSMLVDSMVITLNNSDAFASVGSNRQFTVAARVQQSPDGGQFGRLQYAGPAIVNTAVIDHVAIKTGTGSADFTRANTLAVLHAFAHAESHDCFSLVFDAAEITVTASGD